MEVFFRRVFVEELTRNSKVNKAVAGQGFTLVELLVVISIISLLIAILVPALSKARDTSRSMLCMNNLRSIGQADYMYTADNENWYPRADFYVDNLAQYTGTPTKFYYTPSNKPEGINAFPFICPMMNDRTQWSTLYNAPWASQITRVRPSAPNPAQTCITTYALGSALHGRGTQPTTIPELRWRKTDWLVHSPSVVLNYTEADPGTGAGGVALDYSSFVAYARHGNLRQIPINYADNHVILFTTNGTNPKLAFTPFFRSINNTTMNAAVAPYFWW
jgi:prepilin-type N-terminal cleavage/methylation domain-containing protein